MSNALFTDLSIEQQEIVAGGIQAVNFANGSFFAGNTSIKLTEASFGSAVASTPHGSASTVGGSYKQISQEQSVFTGALQLLNVK
ncbi:hypothetical protein NIES4073_22600 [Kalymmatonema gypsitolerans NIES-4073]|nr:hypothetical protein NIES4073_22590 [Scytonema sp. NIES-4073]BAZ21382.1 hypothetical protein NIES4073_22600 [Scytonema sp. NIES-4073]